MGFTSVYRSLTEIFPQIDSRMLRAVAIEHPKDADEAAAVVLSEILPSLPYDSTHQSRSKPSSPSTLERQVERDLVDVVSKCRGLLVASSSKSNASYSETIPLVIGRGHDDTSAPSTKLVSIINELTNLLPNVGPGFCHKDVESEEVQADSITSVGSLNAEQKLVNINPGDNVTNIQQGNTNDQPSKRSLASENGDTEVDGAFSSLTHRCSVDHLEEIIEDAKTNKKTLLSVMDSVMNLMKEVELEEKDAEKSELEAARGGLDTLAKVEEFKKMLKHAKEANDMHGGEVYGEKSILATEAKELENRLLNLSEERNKSLNVLDEMRETLEIRLAAALEMKKAAEQQKKAKEDSALTSLAEQEAIMEKVVQESKLLQQEAEQNSKLREFLMDRGQVVDSLQGEISVICQDVKLLKEKFENRVPITKSVTSSLASSYGSSMRSLVLETPAEPLNEMLQTSSSNKIPEKEEASYYMSKEKNDCRELLEDGWDIFDKEIEL